MRIVNFKYPGHNSQYFLGKNLRSDAILQFKDLDYVF